MKIQREPTTPGEILSEEFLKPMVMTQRDLADHLGCDVKRRMKKLPAPIPLAG